MAGGDALGLPLSPLQTALVGLSSEWRSRAQHLHETPSTLQAYERIRFRRHQEYELSVAAVSAVCDQLTMPPPNWGALEESVAQASVAQA